MASVEPAGGAGQAAPAAGVGPVAADTKLVKATQDFASMLWEEVLHTALPTDTLMGEDSGAGDVYGGIVEQGFADAVSRGDHGLAKLVLDSLTHPGQGGIPNKGSIPGAP